MLGRLWKGFKAGLSKTRGAFTGVFDLLRGKGKVDQAFLDELEKRLYLADVGTQATLVIVDRVRQAFRDKEITGEVEAFVKKQLRELLTDASPGSISLAGADGAFLAGPDAVARAVPCAFAGPGCAAHILAVTDGSPGAVACTGADAPAVIVGESGPWRAGAVSPRGRWHAVFAVCRSGGFGQQR